MNFLLSHIEQKNMIGKACRFITTKRCEQILRGNQVDFSQYPPMLIDEGEYAYAFFQAYFVQNMVSSALTCIALGYRPIIHLKDRQAGWLNWDTFFETTSTHTHTHTHTRMLRFFHSSVANSPIG